MLPGTTDLAFQGLMGVEGGGVFISQNPMIIGGCVGGCLCPPGAKGVALTPETTRSQGVNTPQGGIKVFAAQG